MWLWSLRGLIYACISIKAGQAWMDGFEGGTTGAFHYPLIWVVLVSDDLCYTADSLGSMPLSSRHSLRPFTSMIPKHDAGSPKTCNLTQHNIISNTNRSLLLPYKILSRCMTLSSRLLTEVSTTIWNRRHPCSCRHPRANTTKRPRLHDTRASGQNTSSGCSLATEVET